MPAFISLPHKDQGSEFTLSLRYTKISSAKRQANLLLKYSSILERKQHRYWHSSTSSVLWMPEVTAPTKGMRIGAELYANQRQVPVSCISFPPNLKLAFSFTLMVLTSTTVIRPSFALRLLSDNVILQERSRNSSPSLGKKTNQNNKTSSKKIKQNIIKFVFLSWGIKEISDKI